MSHRKKFLVRSPAQGLKVIQHKDITANYKRALRWPPQHRKAVLVPCAQTKPFPDAPSHKSGYLDALAGKDVDVWVVSEPLGVVPYAWSRKYPNAHYDFPPQHLRGRAHDVLAGRITSWFKRVGPKYSKITLALPGHHMRLVDKALDMLGYEPTKLVYAGIGDCLDAGACPTGHYRANSHAYRKFLKKRANPPQLNPRLYHRSPRPVDEFDPRRMRFGDYGPGFYFSEQPEKSHVYGDWLHEADVDVANPLNLETTNQAEISRILRSLRVDTSYIMPDGGPPLVQAMGLVQTATEAGMYTPAAVIKVLEHYGYDGIVLPSKGYWSAFRPEQINVLRRARKNPAGDEHMRALERAARAGDPHARREWVREWYRRGLAKEGPLHDHPAYHRFNDAWIREHVDPLVPRQVQWIDECIERHGAPVIGCWDLVQTEESDEYGALYDEVYAELGPPSFLYEPRLEHGDVESDRVTDRIHSYLYDRAYAERPPPPPPYIVHNPRPGGNFRGLP